MRSPESQESDAHVRDAFEKLFGTRTSNRGECDNCSIITSGVFGSPGQNEFYCMDCWIECFRKEWVQRSVKLHQEVSDCSINYELRSLLLALARVGGSIIFPPYLSSSGQQWIYECCELEPELISVQTKIYSDSSSSFHRATTMGIERCDEEAIVCLSSNGQSREAALAQKADEANKNAAEAIAQRDRLQKKLDHAMGLNLTDIPFQELLDLQRAVMEAQHRISEEMGKRLVLPRKSASTWQWQTDDGTFENYEAGVVLKIETHLAQFAEGSAQTLEVTNKGCRVLLDFAEMKQEVIGGSGQKRHIRRADDMLLQEPSWTPQTIDFALVTVEPGTSDYSKVVNLMFKQQVGSLGTCFSPVSVQRIQNKYLLRRFIAERQNLIAQRGAEHVGEQILFHGTRTTIPLEVADGRQGLMTDHAKKGLYGRGLYFATNPRYSHEFAHKTHGDGHAVHYLMLVCRVLCGCSRDMGTTTDKGMTRLQLPPEKYDSIKAGPHGVGEAASLMYVVYQDIQVYPDFLVTYRQKAVGEERSSMPQAGI